MGILASSMVHPEEALVITFDEGGSAESLHVDQFDLGFLGKKTITRATDIVFCEIAQTWEIHLLSEDGSRRNALRAAMDFQSYEQARKAEVGWLNLCRLNDVEPESDHGRVFLNQMRKSLGLAI